MTLRLQPPECWVYESTLQHLNLLLTRCKTYLQVFYSVHFQILICLIDVILGFV